MNRTDNTVTVQLGQGCYMTYNEVSNGFGGRHPVKIVFHNDEKKICRKITDDHGVFVDYPGHEPGEWEKELSMTFFPATRFVISTPRFADGVCRFGWMVQPDGRYWEDEDGYGMTPDNEVWLYALIDEEGQFITPFFDEHNEKYIKVERS